MDKRYIANAGIIFFLIFFSCENKKNYYNHQRHSADVFFSSNDYIIALNPPTLPSDVKILYPENNIKPISGTVSHHILISAVIDRWFSYLKSQREIKTFIIICPNHFQLGDEIVSLSTLDWECNGKIVRTNKKYVKKILSGMRLKEDRFAFHYEHGIGTELLYIKKYFPDADIVPIAMDEFHKQITKCYELSEILSQIIKNDKSVFLLLSTDFSHHDNIKITNERDDKSLKALNSLDIDKVNAIYSDNNVGLITLFLTLKKFKVKNNFIFSHTNSNYFGNENKNDITSYFFTFQY